MGDMGACRGRRNRTCTCVTKNIKYLYFYAVKLFKLIHDPQPVYGLFGEKPYMTKACGLNFEDEMEELNSPSLLGGLGEKLPFPTCFFAFEIFIFSFGLFPFFLGKGFGPDSLRRWTYKTVRAKLFQLLERSGIQEFVVELIKGIALRWQTIHECV